jgi:hypothetical protein
MIKKIVLFFKLNSAARKIVIAASLCLIALVYAGAIYGNFGSLLAKSTPLPINLHSAKQANYSQDPAYMQIPPMQLQLVIDAIWDQNPDTQNLSLRLTQVEEIYYAHVPSITPQPATYTPFPITGTPLPEILTQTTTPSLEVSPSATIPGPTDTSIPGGPTYTTSPLPSTITQPPPTYTATQQPPTNTSSPCGSISISNFSTDSKRAIWSITNNSGSTITVSQINLSWPSGNGPLDKIFLGTRKIWDQTAPPTSVIINSDWTGSSRDIESGVIRPIKFTFITQPLNSGYNLSIKFTNGCTANSSN